MTTRVFVVAAIALGMLAAAAGQAAAHKGGSTQAGRPASVIRHAPGVVGSPGWRPGSVGGASIAGPGINATALRRKR